ncbi:hypothetical protein GCM10027162_52330 [Streptomyces incanus]
MPGSRARSAESGRATDVTVGIGVGDLVPRAGTARPVRRPAPSDRLTGIAPVRRQGRARGDVPPWHPHRWARGVTVIRNRPRNGQESAHPHKGTRQKHWRAGDRE